MQMKEANAWTAAQLGQIKMAGDEAKAKEAGPHGADEWVVRATKADAKKAGKKVCVILRRLGCFFVQPLQENMTLQILSLNVEFAFERHQPYACIEA